MREPWRYLVAIAIVAVATGVAELLYRLLDTTRLSMVFLAGILVAALRLGAWPGLSAALLSSVVYDFYLAEPRFTFTLGAPEDVLVLVTFFVAAFLTGGLAGRVRDEAQRAKAHAAATETLYEASRALSAAWDEEQLRRRLVSDIASAAKSEAALVDGERLWTSPIGVQPPAGPGDPAWRVRPLKVGETELGYAAWRVGEAAANDRITAVLADLGAAAIVRARLGMANSRMEALARTEELRNALLSSISHDFRTPLSAILASASSLKDLGQDLPGEVRDDLLVTIQEEAERLNRFVANLLNMTRLESGALTVEPVAVDLPELADRVWSGLGKRVGRRKLCAAFPGEGLRVMADPMLLEQALANVVENAVRFSPDGSAVSLTAHCAGGGARVDVTDEGPGVPAGERDRIFEKFYRTASSRQIPGTGLGLSIAKGLLEATGGAISAGEREDGRPGLTVSLTLPLAA